MQSDDRLLVTHGWSEDHQCNVFGVRGFGPSYDKLYEDLEKPGEYRSLRHLSSDMSWTYFTFFQEADAVKFMFKNINHIMPIREHPPKTWVKPPDFGDLKWCTRCRKFHEVRDPNATPLQELLAASLAKAIADEIDAEIIAELMKIARK